MFQLVEEGFDSPFEQLVACLISVRTRDETTVPTVQRLFEAAQTSAEVAALSVQRLEELIQGTSFRDTKAKYIRKIAIGTVENYGGMLPCEETVLRSFTGVVPNAHISC
jgi:endonuclease III